MSRSRNDKLRASLAFEAARILADRGDDDYEKARRKAAERLNCHNRKQLPDNAEIAHALDEYRSLYGGNQHRSTLDELRRTALEAMQALRRFNPRLVGPVADGTASAFTPIRLHLFADPPEQLNIELMEMGIHWTEEERQLLFSDGSRRHQPALCFFAGEHAVELICLGEGDAHSPPVSQLTNRPERGLNQQQLQQAIASPL
jgi:hypothetical protein